MKVLQCCFITAHRIVWTRTSAEECYSVKEGVLTRFHQKVQLCGNTLFDHVTLWAQSMIKVQNLPTPKNWGWKFENNKLIPHWSGLPEATFAVSNVVVSQKKAVEDSASVCNLRCFVQNFVFARGNVNRNRHNLICQCLKYTFWSAWFYCSCDVLLAGMCCFLQYLLAKLFWSAFYHLLVPQVWNFLGSHL